MTAAELADSIRLALREIADPSLAPAQQTYMKSTMPYLGVKLPVLRAALRPLTRGVTDADVLREAATMLWREATHREERYAATALLALKPLRGRLDLLNLHEEFIRTGAWWDHVDEVSARITEVLRNHPVEVTQLMLRWTADDDLWIRRSSIISQLKQKEATDLELLTIAIESNIEDTEFFIRKAIGWALREYAKTDAEWVRAFVAAHPDLSGLSRREALKHLS
ncbi:DNA alkylation repair protein [Microbacterium hydrocarbonoxydans]|uniref:DNA alkylation repair protein n=1 Tax=Microbacterium hydrocarbonoxydans TaxID=273678 RepID=UPI0013DAD9BD|nr:DNA alkylation repair protein [Microbacterium hydrocarbonoxydans]